MAKQLVAQRIAGYLRDQGVSKRWLADKAGIPYQVLIGRLNGRSKLCVDEYELICRALEVPYGTFFGEDRRSSDAH